ncbi:hypothetical protein HPO96_37040 [Kribbella sandramycini]|uniref:Uncharacterized protein n=1 Tax=Kribbella sandramycini TaxID=60450 RepID=A0A7Y4L9J5_9ACTN|nr:hypothetical protein [Kribbella sandramycini]MBB6564404.1 hypothetical protein [Kribbella sandramycini]NOL45866.1 hypothetical protein [Kribbella sandramycini]
MDTPATVPALTAELTDLIRRYLGGNSDALPKIAGRVLDLRDRVNDPKGSSREYQDALIAAYDGAGVDRKERQRIQTAVRYHVNRLQETRLSPEERDALELTPGTFQGRKKKKSEDIAAALAAAGFTPGTLHDDPLTALALAVRLLEAVNAAPSLAHLDLVQRTTARALVDKIVEHAESAAAIAQGDN